jgi:hypothetical protein
MICEVTGLPNLGFRYVGSHYVVTRDSHVSGLSV